MEKDIENVECLISTYNFTRKFLHRHFMIFVWFPEVPSITLNPQDSIGLEGDEVTLNCQAKGTPPPTYQWYVHRSSIPPLLREKKANIVQDSNVLNNCSKLHFMKCNSLYVNLAKGCWGKYLANKRSACRS